MKGVWAIMEGGPHYTNSSLRLEGCLKHKKLYHSLHFGISYCKDLLLLIHAICSFIMLCKITSFTVQFEYTSVMSINLTYSMQQNP